MWSGPRNLSTAMMRSFASRTDCQAMDEPFYAAALKATGMDHPMRDEIVATCETDPFAIARRCLVPQVPDCVCPISYQKHMMHHMVDGFPMDWTERVTNAFLIRDPARVLASYAEKWTGVTARDVGLKEQRALFERIAQKNGKAPAVIDAADIRRHPETALKALCAALGIVFDPAMLAWKAGPRPEDGIWGRHWYGAVWRSTGFAPPEDGPPPELPPNLKAIYGEAIGDYDYLRGFCLEAARETATNS